MGKKMKAGSFAVEVEQTPELWRDRKRHLGLPLSFTIYSLNINKLLVNTGLLNLKEDEILLYRIRDVRMTQSLGERLFGVGTLHLVSSDASMPMLDLAHIKNPRKVKEVLSQCVEDARRRNNIRSTEIMAGGPGDPDDDGIPGGPGLPPPPFEDADGDGIPDDQE